LLETVFYLFILISTFLYTSLFRLKY
jgi:hypothetical protein